MMPGAAGEAVDGERSDGSGPEAAHFLAKLLHGRYSCRAYRPDPVPRETIASILAMAQRTASWCNAQPWKVVITTGSGTDRFREVLRHHAEADHPLEPDLPFPTVYQGEYARRRKECAQQLYQACGIARGDRGASRRQALENFTFFGAPHAAIVTTEQDLGVYGAIDCGGYMSNFILAAHSHGVSSIPQAALAAYGPLVRKHFALPANRRIVCGISFGYPAVASPANGFRTPRSPIDEVVTWVDE